MRPIFSLYFYQGMWARTTARTTPVPIVLLAGREFVTRWWHHHFQELLHFLLGFDLNDYWSYFHVPIISLVAIIIAAAIFIFLYPRCRRWSALVWQRNNAQQFLPKNVQKGCLHLNIFISQYHDTFTPQSLGDRYWKKSFQECFKMSFDTFGRTKTAVWKQKH